MVVRNEIVLAVRRWAAWPPGVADAAGRQRWAEVRETAAPARPDMSFVAPLQRRRLSEVTRIAFAVAAKCLDEGEPAPGFVFCSRYGEYAESFASMQQIVRNEPISPTAFSMSVHNTAASQLAVHRKDRAPCSALAAGESTLETGFVEAFAQTGESGRPVMLVYHDQPLPELYREQPTTVRSSLALAMLLERPAAGGEGRRLRLEWLPSEGRQAAVEGNSVCAVIRLLEAGGVPVVQDTGRLVWTWSGQGARH